MGTIKLLSGSILMIFLVICNWKITYTIGCFALLFPLIVLVLISSSFIELRMHERKCFRNCYFNEVSGIYRLLSSKLFITVLYLIISIMMTISIMYGVIDYVNEIWIYLPIHAVLVVLLYIGIGKVLRNTVKENYLSIFSRESTINISSLILLIVYIYLFVNGYEPLYLSDNLRETMENASSSISSSCSTIDVVLRVKVELDSLFWWLTSQSAEKASNELTSLLIWLIFIFINSLAILGLNRYMAQIVYLLDKMLNKGNDTK